MYALTDNLIKLVSEGTDDGAGKGHVRFAFRNKKKVKTKLRLRKYNPVARTHTWYVEKK